MGFKIKQIQDNEKIIIVSDQDESNHIILNNLGDLLALRQRLNRYIDTQEYDGQINPRLPLIYQETLRNAEANSLLKERGYGKLSNSTLNAACARGRIIGAHKVGGRWEFPRKAFENWFKEWLVKKTSKGSSVHFSNNSQLPIDKPLQALQSLWIDKINKEVWVKGQRVKLSVREYDILEYLYQSPDRLCSRFEILKNVFGPSYTKGGESALNSALHRLRLKLEENPDNPCIIVTVHGQGIKLNLAISQRTSNSIINTLTEQGNRHPVNQPDY